MQNKHTKGSRIKALGGGIEIGKQESADKIEEQDQQIKEQKWAVVGGAVAGDAATAAGAAAAAAAAAAGAEERVLSQVRRS